ncbi:unnamed protein product [Brassicogethes aeneus]|uniref:Uncharacterized protein n=1 Tax=Brassicogethes aeneus TaxID=1431903 RepID=A0A9P0BBJ1_BRAAE|nr:unnamed protein product [Brassicogethes aeneus]
MIKTRKNDIKLTQLSMLELKDLLDRENKLVNNRKLFAKLPDKGESVIRFRDKIQEEINNRNEICNIEQSLNKLSLDVNFCNKDKHIQKLCTIENKPDKERYKPFSTLNKQSEHKVDTSKFIEDPFFDKTTKLVNLPESLNILSQQEERVKSEQYKSKFERELEKILQQEGGEKTESETEESSESEKEDIE